MLKTFSSPTIASLKKRSTQRAALSVLKRGGVIVFPTDTVYGLGGNALKPSVVRRIRRMKARPQGKPFPWLVGDLTMAERYARFSPEARVFAKKMWPGATTLVLSKRGRRGTLALRVPNHAWLRRVIRRFGRPLIGTSANIGGKKPARIAVEALQYFPNADLIIDGGRCAKQPSRIVDAKTWPPRVLRS